MIFTVRDFAGLHTVEVDNFTDALDAADRLAGSLNASITDEHGCRWTVRRDEEPELMECPRDDPSEPCACAEIHR